MEVRQSWLGRGGVHGTCQGYEKGGQGVLCSSAQDLYGPEGLQYMHFYLDVVLLS